MELKLYKTLDDENVINKAKEVRYTMNIKMKGIVDIINPSITLNDKGTMDFNTCNYCYVEEFKRFYFIRSIDNKSNHMWQLHLECDVLESFKTEILNSTVEVNRGMKKGEYFQTGVKFETVRDVTIYKSAVELGNEKTMILTTIGGAE